MNIHDFIKKYKIEFYAVTVFKNPNMASEWDKKAKHYQILFERQNEDQVLKQLVTFYSMGSGLKKRPTATEVLDCLAMDANGSDESFNDWCGNYGYDTDSTKARKIYEVIQNQTTKLQEFLGDEAFNILINDVERL